MDTGNRNDDLRELVEAVNWGNLFNPRMWLSAGVTAFLALIPIAYLAPDAAGPVFFVVFFAALALMALNPAKCPRCGRRIKVGADTCRSCGANMQTVNQ